MIRPALASDSTAIYDLVCDMEKEMLPRAAFNDIFLMQLVDGCYRCLVDEEDGKVAGFVNLRFERQLHHAAMVAEIMELVVADGMRGAGRGSRLIEAACNAARAAGAMQIEVDCNQRRTRAHVFYGRKGFTNTHYKFVREL